MHGVYYNTIEDIIYKVLIHNCKDGFEDISPRPVARGGSVGADEPPSKIKGPLF